MGNNIFVSLCLELKIHEKAGYLLKSVRLKYVPKPKPKYFCIKMLLISMLGCLENTALDLSWIFAFICYLPKLLTLCVHVA